MQTHEPMVIEVTRGDLTESRHQVLAVMTRADGTVIRSWGDASSLIYARSALKPLQACAVVSRSEGQFEFTEQELALACASHNGEEVHVAVVLGWLARLGLGPEHLECGAHEPIDPQEARALIESREKPGSQHNNCSGKHCGLLTLALALRASPQSYTSYDHPVQVELRRSLSRLLGYSLDEAPWASDGCSIPTYAMPLSVLARAFGQLMTPSNGSTEWPECSHRIVAAITRHPYLVAGRNRFDTAVMSALPGRVIVKGGAEGVCAAGVADTGIGIALKVIDGGRRAADVAMSALLNYAGALDTACLAEIKDFAIAPVRNVVGRLVGVVRHAESDR